MDGSSDTVGPVEGLADALGSEDGLAVGALVGAGVGLAVGLFVGLGEGTPVGLLVGLAVGFFVGLSDGLPDGRGETVGLAVFSVQSQLAPAPVSYRPLAAMVKRASSPAPSRNFTTTSSFLALSASGTILRRGNLLGLPELLAR